MFNRNCGAISKHLNTIAASKASFLVISSYDLAMHPNTKYCVDIKHIDVQEPIQTNLIYYEKSKDS